MCCNNSACCAPANRRRCIASTPAATSPGSPTSVVGCWAPSSARPTTGNRRNDHPRYEPDETHDKESPMTRPDGRANDELRFFFNETATTEIAAGSVLVTFGKTRVLCTASIDENVPRWMKNTGKGWVTAEYSMLPGASPERIDREAAKGKQSGRTVEIQRLIGRSLRAACDMQLLGERQVVVDCDVLQADGGTRTASICGGYIALHDALTRLVERGAIGAHPLIDSCAAISVGIIDGT